MNQFTSNFFKKVFETHHSGQTKLHLAAFKNDLPEAKRLLSEGADVNALDIHNQTPLHYSSIFNVNSHNFSINELLLKHGAKVNAQDDEGKTPLYYLVRNDSGRTIRLFLEFKAYVNIRDHECETPLFNAVRKGNVRVIELLLDQGSNVNEINRLKLTPLHVAAERCDVKVVKCLYKRNFNVYQAGKEDQIAPIKMLRESKSPKLSRFLLKYTDMHLVNLALKIIPSQKVTNESFWIVIVKHLAKREALGVELSNSVLETLFNNEEYRTYFEKCKEELGMAKSTKFENCWVSCFNLLVDSKRKLKNYAGNEDLVEGFREIECVKMFPIYGAEIQEYLEKGIERRKLFDKSTERLSSDLPIFSPTHLVVRDVLDCLSMKDYVRLTSEQLSV